MIEVLEEWGRRLTAISFVYSIISMIIVFAYAYVGLTPPPLEPQFIINIYWRAYSVWQQLNGAMISGDYVAVAVRMMESMGYLMGVVVSLLASVAINFAWFAVLVVTMLPAPYNVLSIPIFVGAFFANLAVLFYLLNKAKEIFSKFLPPSFVSV